MSITRKDKETAVSFLNDGVNQANAVVLADFTGINVEQMTDLRNRMREADVTFKVVKNTLLKRALNEVGVDSEEGVFGLLNGPTAIAYASDEVAPAKILKDFSKEHKGIPVVKGGFVSGRTFSVEEILSLADMPSREELLAKVLGSANAPLQGFVMVTSGVIRKFLYAVNAVRDSKSD